MEQLYLLAADVGGSSTRLRLKPLEGRGPKYESTAESGEDIIALVDQMDEFVQAKLPPNAHLEHAVLGLPGKVSGDRQSCAISYLDPKKHIDFREIFGRLGVKRGILANDVECGVFGLAATLASQLELLCGEKGEGSSVGPSILGMPGTGLGVGILLPPGITLPSDNQLPWAITIPSEGGHLPAAIRPDEEVELGYWRLTSSAVSTADKLVRLPTWEHLLCGKAIPRLFGCLVDAKYPELRKQMVLDGVEPASVSRWAMEDPKHRCYAAARETFAYYGRFLGRAMQSAALLVLAKDVYLAGDILLAIHEPLTEEFKDSFQSNDVHGELLGKLPVWLIKNPNLNLDGATRMAEALSSS